MKQVNIIIDSDTELTDEEEEIECSDVEGELTARFRPGREGSDDVAENHAVLADMEEALLDSAAVEICHSRQIFKSCSKN